MYFYGKLVIEENEIEFRCEAAVDSVGADEHERSVYIPNTDKIEILDCSSEIEDAENLVRENFYKARFF